MMSHVLSECLSEVGRSFDDGLERVPVRQLLHARPVVFVGRATQLEDEIQLIEFCAARQYSALVQQLGDNAPAARWLAARRDRPT